MLSFALTVALAAPCGIPKQPHHHSHIAAVQSCAAPIVPMCFREPVDIDILPLSAPLLYYVLPPVADDIPAPDGDYAADLPPVAVYGGGGSFGGLGGYEGGGYAPIAPPGGSPAPGQTPPSVKAPEIAWSSAPAAITFTLCLVALAKGRKA